MKKAAVPSLILLTILVFQGCAFPPPYPIEDTQNILVAGFDLDGEDIVLTVLVDSVTSSSESGEKKVEYQLYMGKGASFFEAKRAVHKFSAKRVSFFHTGYMILGEEAAKEGIDKILKILTQDDETNFLHKLMIVKDMTAKEYLEHEIAGKGSVPDLLKSLFAETKNTGYAHEIKVLDYAISRETASASLYMPTLLLRDDPIQVRNEKSTKDSGQSEGEQPKLSVLEGYGVFDDDKLIGYIEGKTAQAFTIIVNEFSSGPISIKDSKGQPVGLEVLGCITKIKPSYDTSPLSAKIEVCIETNLDEYQETEDVLTNEYIEYLEEQENTFVKKEIEETLRFLQMNGTDAIGMGDAFYHKDPGKWKEIKDDWKSLFQSLDITIEVKSTIRRTYVTKNAIGESK